MHPLTVVFAAVLSVLVAQGVDGRTGPRIVAVPWGTSSVTDLPDGATARKLLFRDSLSLPALVFCYDRLDVNSLRLAATIGQAADLLQGFAPVYAVDARNPALHWLLDAWQVQVTPTLKLLPPRGQQRTQHEKSLLRHIGSGVKVPLEYTDRDLSPDAIRRWVLSHLPSNTIERVPDQAKQHLLEIASAALAGEDSGQRQLPLALLFTDKDSTSQLARALSASFASRLQFLEVFKGSAPSIVSHFRVEKFPTLLLFQGKKDPVKRNHGPIAYEGRLTIADIGAFFNEYVASPAKAEALRAKQEKRLLRKAKEEAENPMGLVRTAEDWHREVLQHAKITAVFFMDDSSPESIERSRRINAMLLSEKGIQHARKGIKWVRIDRRHNPELYRHFIGDSEESEDLLVFIHTKKESSTKFVGALDPERVLGFVQKQLAAGTGSKPMKVADLPPFRDAAATEPQD